MTSNNLFSIIIPTRQRHDTLKYSIQSVINQSYKDFELVVMDNFSSPETAEVVASYEDSRIKYYRTDERLSMSDNWELGLSHAQGEYILILGDDDALIPDALESCLKLTTKYKVDIVSWFRYQYWWPNAIVPWQRNRLYLNLLQIAEVWNSREKLKQFYNSQAIFENLPMIYNSFIHRSVIAKVKAVYGRYFMTYIPDVESGIVNAYFSDKYLYSFRALSIAGLSGHSTGTSGGYESLGEKPLKEFIKEQKKDIIGEIHHSLIQSTNQEISVADIQFRTKDLYFPEDEEIKVDMKNLLDLIASRINRDSDRYEKTLSDINAIAQKHEISTSEINIPHKSNNISEAYQGQIYEEDGSITTLVINCEQVGISNVAQAAKLAQGILPRIEFVRVNTSIQQIGQQKTEGKVERAIPRFLLDGVFFQLFNTGIYRLWNSLLEEWVKNGFAKQIVVIDRNGTAPKIPGIWYRTVPLYNYGNTEADREMLQQVCDEESADVFISTYYTTPISTPSVFMAYDMVPEVMEWDMNLPVWKDKHHAIRYASSYLAISENTANDLVTFFPEISRESIEVAHCGFESIFSQATSQEINEFKNKYGIAKPYFLLVGLRDGYKNVMLFFQAFSQLKNQDNFVIVCVGGEDKLEEDSATYVSETNVHLLPHIDDAELRVAYSGATALVYPSKYEGFGLPIVEAMACGCPIITCPNASIPEVAGEAALYVKDDDVKAMTIALRDIQNPDVRESLIAAGFEQGTKFSWSRMAKKVSSVLIEATLLPLKLSETNFIIFPDWSQSEADLGRELEKVITTILTHPDSQQITLLIDTSNLDENSEIDANLLLSGVVMNLLMQEDLEMTGEPEISLVGKLGELQWQALLPRIQDRISLVKENEQAIGRTLLLSSKCS